MTISTQDLVTREVFANVSYLVAAIGKGDAECNANPADLRELIEQAWELSAPISDYEEALIQEGYIKSNDNYWSHPEYGGFDESAESICDFQNIDPYGLEIFEHWIVSEWFADQLEAKGEKVERDFAGQTIWGRTTTGQAIFLDSVVEDIRADLVKRHAT